MRQRPSTGGPTAWKLIKPTGASTHLWLDPTNDQRPEYGVWTTPDGRDAEEVLGAQGPDDLGFPVWWEPPSGHRGKRLPDLIWQTSMCALKIMSIRLADLLDDHGASLQRFDLDLRRNRKHEPLTGYVGALEPLGDPEAPVHSYWRTRRSLEVVATDEIATAVKAAKLLGIEVEPADQPFPGGNAPGR